MARLGRLPWASARARRWLLPAYPSAVRDLGRQMARDHRRCEIDLVISTSSAAIKGLAPPPGVPHLCYCHSPARYVWSRKDEYTKGVGLASTGLRLFGPSFRAWDRRSARNVTRFIANSSYTAGQIRSCYGRDATVVHPPVETAFFTPAEEPKREDYWLLVGAMEPYKRADLAIATANQAAHPLVVVGQGTQRAQLERLAGPTVTFTGSVSDRALREHYRRARLLLFPQVEDFGITAVEAQACGCPVVARGEGGALDTVLDGDTGSLFHESSSAAMIEAIARCPTGAHAACRSNSLRFSVERFVASMRAEIAACLDSGQRNGDASS
ncbi:MAG: glycosyltransferase [Planctomycetes bacterium]|nr:glycosyltransferase [Planctomycetota bacterium]